MEKLLFKEFDVVTKQVHDYMCAGYNADSKTYTLFNKTEYFSKTGWTTEKRQPERSLAPRQERLHCGESFGFDAIGPAIDG